MPQAQPELKKVSLSLSKSFRRTRLIHHPQYLDKRVEVQLNGSRKVMGTLRGYDVRFGPAQLHHKRVLGLTVEQVFLNVVLDEATESKPSGEKVRIGMCVIRGNSVVMMEALDRIDGDGRGGR